MGNVLGFQFQAGERNEDGDQSGELRFFRCSGVGRELLLGLSDIACRGQPARARMCLLMSATSWAGTSSRYHLHAPVDAVLRPHDDEVAAIKRATFRKQFLYRPGRHHRPAAVRYRPSAASRSARADAAPTGRT